MKIALIGYGKMGHAIERHAIERGHEIVCRIDADNLADFDSPEFASADVAIEFTAPSAAVGNYRRALAAGVPVVSGTTGWTDHLEEVKQMVADADGALLWSSNFSIGVNIFMEVNRFLASIMDHFPQYQPSLTEIHHIHKLDHPSGTAISLANDIVGATGRIERWTEDDPAEASALVVRHERVGEVPGTHVVSWESAVDTITIEHKAHSRDGFALGAVMAAEWILGRRGFLSFGEMFASLLQSPNPSTR